jgi:predicted PurR-regulated permease PerM
MTEERFRKTFLVLLVVAISIAFLALIQSFLLTILLAAIFAGVAHPIYLRLQRLLRGSRVLASLCTLILLLALVIVPLLGLVGAVANEALQISENVRPWIERTLQEPSALNAYVARIPFVEEVEPIRAELLTRGGELVGNLGAFLFKTLSATTRGTVVFFFHFFILLYAMFFFLMDGKRMLQASLAYLPLTEADTQRMLDRFTSVTRATLKGTILIGVLQGALTGLAFWVLGIEGAIFWTTLMIVLSIIPGVGIALVWVPAAIVLMVQGAIAQGIGLAIFCSLIVGSVDNVLRPRLVGRDTKMHDLLILFSTLGGIFVFGVTGFIVGPIIAALFITVWEIFGSAFRDVLPEGSETVPRG